MDANIAVPAALIGDPTRAAILLALLDGRAQPASALAWAAGATAQAASNHLAKLVDGGLLKVEQQGRHRYYRLARPEVAYAIEGLACLAPSVRSLAEPRSAKARTLRQGRCCYGHLAGVLGVQVADAMVARGILRPAEDRLYEVTPAGRAWFEELGVVAPTQTIRPKAARQCLDWTERRHHLAGPLGVSLLDRMIALGWMLVDRNSRAAWPTNVGRAELQARLGLRIETVAAPAAVARSA